MTDSSGEMRSALVEAYAALRADAVLVKRPELGILELVGEDRARFLNGMVTCDVVALEPGSGTHGFFTDVKGRILSDAVIQVTAETLRVRLPRGSVGPTAEHLSKYIIADRVEVRPLEAAAVWSLAGPGAAARLAKLDLPLPATPWAHQEVRLAEDSVMVSANPRFAVDVIDFVTQEETGDALAARLGRETGGGAEAFEALRVEAGVARFGVDFDSGHLPQETGRDDAVSYTKGCYLGQEVVARVHYLGEPSRALRGLALDAHSPPDTPAVLISEGREVGALTSASWSPRLERAIGLGIVKRRAALAGTRLVLADGSAAEVVGLPFEGRVEYSTQED